MMHGDWVRCECCGEWEKIINRDVDFVCTNCGGMAILAEEAKT